MYALLRSVSRLARSSEFRALLRTLWLDALALVWPTCCVGCGAADRDCCDACLRDVRATRPTLRRDASVPVLARAPYDGPIRAMLVALKHGGRTSFARELGAQLAIPLREALAAVRGTAGRETVGAAAPGPALNGSGVGGFGAGGLGVAGPGGTGPGVGGRHESRSGPGGCGLGTTTSRDPPLIVTVPSRAASERRRGYRHVDLLVRVACRSMSVERVRALRPLRGRTGQVGLSAAERQRNASLITVRRRARSKLSGRDVVLVDDIVTTGATVSGAAEALERAGARVVAVVALCLVERRDARGRESCGSETS